MASTHSSLISSPKCLNTTHWNIVWYSTPKSENYYHSGSRLNFLYLLIKMCTPMPIAPKYLSDLVCPYKPARALRSANNNLLTVVWTHVKAEDNSFVVAATT